MDMQIACKTSQIDDFQWHYGLLLKPSLKTQKIQKKKKRSQKSEFSQTKGCMVIDPDMWETKKEDNELKTSLGSLRRP